MCVRLSHYYYSSSRTPRRLIMMHSTVVFADVDFFGKADKFERLIGCHGADAARSSESLIVVRDCDRFDLID